MLCLTLALSLAAAEVEASEEAHGADAFETFVLPSLAYTPRTSVLLGTGVILSFEDPDVTEPLQSSLTGFGYVTVRRQWGTGVTAQTYFLNDRALLDARVDLFDGVSFFFGVGDSPRAQGSEFNVRDLRADLAVLGRVYDTIFVGPLLRGQRRRARDIDDSTLLALPGSERGELLGAGLRLIWDRRDRALWTQAGTFLRASVVAYDERWVSDFSHVELELEARGFVELGRGWVLGAQALTEARDGRVPLFRYAIIGGPTRLRGTFSGRFRDLSAWLAQAELRSPRIWWRLAAVAFVGFGAVAASPRDFVRAEGTAVAGAGLRAAVTDEGANLRLDYGVGSDGETAFYFSLGEAF